MSEWTDQLPGAGRGGGTTEPAGDGTGRVADGTSAPPPARTAPLPGMPSSTAAGRTDVVRRPRGTAPDPTRPGARPRCQIPRRRPTRRRRAARLAILTVTALLVSPVGAYVWAGTELDQDVDLGTLKDRAPSSRGTNYLIVGSDSREGLSEQARKNLRTGSTEGRRTDSMILLHTGAGGTTMMSLPRDSWVTIPSFLRPETGRRYPDQPNKLNAAFSLGGPRLLVRAIERSTGLHIDHYTEIGLAGFVDIVDAVGGVDMCLDRAIKDKNSGADLRAGCQTLNGAQALAFVRQRKQEAEGDLGRARNQQKFLAALAKKTATPGTLLNPAKAFPTLGAGLDTLIVDKDTGLRDLTSLFQSMRKVTRGDGRQINVPVSDPAFRTSKGVAVKWDMAKARQLFSQLRADRPVTLQPGRQGR